AQADGAARIELAGAVHREIDLVPGGGAQVRVALADLSKHRTVEGLDVWIAAAALAATTSAAGATAAARAAAAAAAAANSDPELEGGESFRLPFAALCPGAAHASI